MSTLKVNTVESATTPTVLISDGLSVSGVSTLTGGLKVGTAITMSDNGNFGITGIMTASNFVGSGANLTGIAAGVQDFDTWYLTASHTGNTNPIENNWSRWTSLSGTGSVTFSAPSSGIWTFPSTGFWKIDFMIYNMSDGNNSERGCNNNMYVTTNNSSYTFVGEAATSLVKADDNTNISKGYTLNSYIFDVTDTSTHKVKFANGYNQRAGTCYGHGSYLYTHVKFMKLRST